MTARFGPLLVTAGLLCGSSCADTGASEQSSSHLPGPTLELEIEVGPQTTDGLIAEHNLQAQIQGLRDAAQRDLAGLDVEDALVDALLLRAQFFGTWSDFDEALARSDAQLREHPDSGSAAELRARSLAAVHRFAAARGVLGAAATTPSVEAALFTLDEATGAAPEAVLEARERAVEREGRTFSALTALARALAQVGRFEDADAAYVEAAETFGDVSPFPIAWIAFSRGVMWGEVAGQPDLARPLYEEAIRRLPGYVVANVHLAELEADAGERQRATERLRNLAREQLVDPEPSAVLGRIAADAEATQQALDGYEQALERYPEAVWDHATEFYLSGGESPQRAHELAALNLELRPTERAYLLAIRASLAIEDTARARELAADVRIPVHTADLRELIDELE